MQKQSAMRIAVKRTEGAEGAWDSSPRIEAGSVAARPDPAEQIELWPWNRVLEGAGRQLDQYISLEPKVLKGRDPEAIHDIRVASRRLQQVLDLVHPPPGPAKVRPKVQKIRRTIRRSRRALSEVRNCDVLLERAGRILARKRAARREVWTAFRDFVQERRDKSFRKASRRLSKLNLPALYLRLRELLEPPAPPTGQADSPGEETNLRRRMTESLQETWASLAGCVIQAREMPEAPSLHAVRIAAKKVRYLLEVAQALEVPGSAEAVATLRRLQTHLGDWHDLEVQDEMMLEMIGQEGFLTDRLELAMDVERLVLRNRKSKFGYVEQFLRMTGGSQEWLQLSGWVRDFLANGGAGGDASRQTGEEEPQSPALPPPRA
jgi:CHAD domain-containing protein